MKIIRIFIASPSDVSAERNLTIDVIERINRTIGKKIDMHCEVLRWENVVPGMGRPEDIILNQMPVSEWDLFVGILWQRFGSPSGAMNLLTKTPFQSGTEEEFNSAYKSWNESRKPAIMFYRCIRPASTLEEINTIQLEKINSFFSQFSTAGSNPGIYRKYNTPNDFEKLLHDDLVNYLLTGPSPEMASYPPKEIITIKEIEFVGIPESKFLMGCNSSSMKDDQEQAALEYDAIPQHNISLSKYYISRYPITNHQYKIFVEATGRGVPHRQDEWSSKYNWDKKTREYPIGMEKFPVVLVSWNDAKAFCDWMGVELPTEAQWEKAARGIDGRRWPWGNSSDYEKCNTAMRDKLRGLCTIGLFSPYGDSPYGVGDMAGNVLEWCRSIYKPYPYSATDGREDEIKKEERRVLRGGSWDLPIEKSKTFIRASAPQDDYGFSIGFRVVMK